MYGRYGTPIRKSFIKYGVLKIRAASVPKLVRIRLDRINYSASLSDLWVSPGNCLKRLKSERDVIMQEK